METTAIDSVEQRIIDEIIYLLNELYPEYPAYDVRVEMGLEPPCFIVESYNSRLTERITDAGFFYATDCQIVFYPGQSDPEILINAVKFPILTSLRRFGRGRPKLRGDNIYAQTREGLLYIFFGVTSHIKQRTTDDLPRLKRLKTEVRVKDERK